MKIFALLALAALPAFAQAGDKGKTEVTWYGHAAFVVKTPGGTTLAIDPWINNPLNKDKGAIDKIQKLDYILISHGHFDHVGDAACNVVFLLRRRERRGGGRHGGRGRHGRAQQGG